MAETPLERTVLDRHRKHPNPHPQYARLTDLAERVGAVVGSTVGATLVIGASALAGISDEAARADHTHALPGYATPSVGGFMSSTDKARLDSLAAASTSFSDLYFHIVGESDHTKALYFDVSDQATGVRVDLSTGAQTVDGATIAFPPVAGDDTVALVGVANAFTGANTFSAPITSTVATGAAPLVVASTTLVANLNADLLDGHDSAYFATATATAAVASDLAAHLADTTAAHAASAISYTPTTLVSTDVDSALDELAALIAGAGPGYSDEQAQDAIGAMVATTATIALTYVDATPALTADVVAGSIGPTQLAATTVTGGTYAAATITVDAQGRITAASANTIPTSLPPSGSAGGDLAGSYPNPTLAVARALASRQILAGTGLTGGGDLTADRTLTVAYGATGSTACVGNDSRLSDARTPTGAAGGSLSGTYPNPSVSLAAGSVTGTMLAPLAIQISTLPAGSSSFNSSADGVYLSSTGCLYLAQQTANKVAKINVVTGVTTLIAPPSGTIGARCGVVYSTTLGKLIVGTNTGFFLMNPTTNATTALVTPTSWGGINLAYDETNDWVYCTDTSWKFNRIHSGGTSQAASTNAFASNGARVLVVGTDCFALDTVSKIHKINPSSWPAEATTALSLGVVLTQDSGLAYNSATSKILVGGTLGNIFVVDPSALTLTSTVNVGGTSNIQNIITTATRIYCFDAAGKIWILDANTYATLNYIWPQSAFSSPGLVYDTDRGVLNAPGASSSSVFRFLA